MAQARVLCRVSDVPEKRIFVQHMNIGTEREIVYPSVWFNANGEVKPEILVMPNHNIPRAHIHATIREGFRTNTLDHRELGRNQSTLNEDWRSFNRVIGLQGNHRTLAHIVNVVPNEAAVPMLVGADDMTDQEVLKYVIAICAIYRPGQITRDDYRNQVVENVNALLEPLGEPVLDIAVAVVNFKKWIAYQPYVKMTAAIDMMLNEFPHHVFAQARIGTIVTRFKDCEALISTQTITKCLGLDFLDFAEWIWSHSRRGGDGQSEILRHVLRGSRFVTKISILGLRQSRSTLLLSCDWSLLRAPAVPKCPVCRATQGK